MRRRRSRRGTGDVAPAGAPAWMVTYGDLVTQILAFFVLLYSFSSLNETKFREILDSLQNSFGLAPASGSNVSGVTAAPSSGSTGTVKPLTDASLRGIKERIASELEDRGVSKLVTFEGGNKELILHFDAAALFNSGQAEVKQSAVPALEAIGQVLNQVPNQVRIEGHTDSDPMIPNPQYPDNWMLSGARAAGVLRFLYEFHQIPYGRMSFAGYADTRPVASNDTPEGKARNRRVDIVVLGR